MKCIFQMILLVVLCCYNPLSAQEEKNTKYAVKLYYGMSYSWDNSTSGTLSDGTYQTYERQRFSLSSFTPALTIFKPKSMHEFGLPGLSFSRERSLSEIVNENDNMEIPTSGGIYKRFQLTLPYEYAYRLWNISDKWSFLAGVRTSASMILTDQTPYVSNLFPRTGNQFGVGVSLVPRLNFSLGNKWFLDFNTPISTVSFVHYRGKVEDPTVPSSERLDTETKFTFFNEVLSFRLGLGLKL